MPSMPLLLDIASSQPSLHNYLGGALRTQNFIQCRALSTSYTTILDKRSASWKTLYITKTTKLNEGNIRLQRGVLLIKAVATLEPKTLSRVQNERNGGNGSHPSVQLTSSASQVESSGSGSDSECLDEREKLRRMRISKANKGNTPWNKGRKHSPETLQRIRERTKLAMQNPKVKMKLVNLGHAQSKETRVKIGVGVRIGWRRRRERLMVQEGIYFDWQNLIAEASRNGYIGQEELQWDSYQILSEKLQQEWLESVEQRKTMPRPKGNKRAPKSAEQRRKIAEAIAAKWANPEYRERVYSGLAKYHGSPVGVKKRRSRKPSDSTLSTKQNSTKKAASTNDLSRSENSIQAKQLRVRSNKPSYKDPLASSKLEMIKNIRAERAAAETRKVEAIKRARLLIAEAEKAAKALEVAALKSPVAQASLVETRKLIAEAVQSIESIEAGDITTDVNGRNSPAEAIHSVESTETGQLPTNENDRYSSAESTEFISPVEKMPSAGQDGSDHADKTKINGTQTHVSDEKELGFEDFALHDILHGDGKLLLPSSSDYGLHSSELESLIKQPKERKQQLGQLEPNGHIKYDNVCSENGAAVTSTDKEKHHKPVTKKWVRGRLVEVTK